MRILLATGNPHKVDEIRAIFGEDSGVELLSLADVGLDIPEPVEDQPTFEGNALLKARYYALAAHLPCLADDSGLEVDALDGEPGVRSARYADARGSRSVVYRANNWLLLKKLEAVADDDRTARFVCVMVLADADGEQMELVRGMVEGVILREPRGDNGFGYDPVFFVPAEGCTAAQMTPQQKNEISHRGRAARQMRDALMRRRGA